MSINIYIMAGIYIAGAHYMYTYGHIILKVLQYRKISTGYNRS